MKVAASSLLLVGAAAAFAPAPSGSTSRHSTSLSMEDGDKSAMRLQNSTVAHRKGIIPMINTSFELSDISIGGERFHPGSPTYDCSCRVQLSDWNVFLPDLFQGIRYLSR